MLAIMCWARVARTTANITAKNLTISGAVANSKQYDGNATATVNFTGARWWSDRPRCGDYQQLRLQCQLQQQERWDWQAGDSDRSGTLG